MSQLLGAIKKGKSLTTSSEFVELAQGAIHGAEHLRNDQSEVADTHQAVMERFAYAQICATLAVAQAIAETTDLQPNGQRIMAHPAPGYH
jgi:hypothetical protein